MKVAAFCGPGDVRVMEMPDPGEPGEGMILLRPEFVALCGTDVSQFRRPTMVPLFHPHEHSNHMGPTVMGHETVGIIEAIGPGVTNLHVGQRIIPGSGWWCGRCEMCRAGRTNICERYFLFGIHAPGGMAERAVYPAKMCVPVPQECTPEVAVLSQPCAVAIHALDRARIEDNQTVALFGVGGIGSLILAVLRAQQKKNSIYAVDIVKDAVLTAAHLNVHALHGGELDPVKAILRATRDRGCDVVIEATGVPAVFKQAFSCIRRGGRLLQVGISKLPVNVLLDRLVQEEKEVLGTNGQINETDLARALDLLTRTNLASNIPTTMIDLDDLIEYGLLPLVEHRAHGKIVVRINAHKAPKDSVL